MDIRAWRDWALRAPESAFGYFVGQSVDSSIKHARTHTPELVDILEELADRYSIEITIHEKGRHPCPPSD